MLSRQRLVKNISSLMISQVIGWVLGLLLTIYLPRHLGVVNYGKLSLAGSLWIIISNIATFGMDTYLTREIARNRSQLNLLLSQSFLLRLLFFSLGTIFLTVYIKFADYSPDTLQVISVLAISCFISLMSGGIIATIQALERMEIIAFSSILASISNTVLCFLAIFGGYGFITIAWISNLTSFIVFVFLSYSLIRFQSFNFQLSGSNIKVFLKASLAFFLLYIFINLYNQIDNVVISLLIDEHGVGVYSVSDKLLGSLFFVPTIFMTVFFPTFSRLAKENGNALTNLFRKTFHLMVWIGTALGLGTLIISNQVIHLIYGPDFLQSGPILGLKGISIVCNFANIILGIYLISIDRQKYWITVLAIATFIQIPLDILFVPMFETIFSNGALGAGLSCVLTEIGMTIAGLYLIPKQTLTKDSMSFFIRTSLAGLAMVLGGWWVRNEFILFPVLIGASLYLVFSYKLKLFSGEEWTLFIETMMTIKSKINRRVSESHG